jgi:hypothetical protein
MAQTDDPASTSKGPQGTRPGAYPPNVGDPTSREAVDLDVSRLVSPDLMTVDALARLHLDANRAGRSLWLHGASRELGELLELVGLREVVHLCPCLGGGGDRVWRVPPRQSSPD